MSEEKKYRILVSGGGTGGHIFPALSIANEIKRRHEDAEILFIGADNRMEMEKVPAAGYRIIGLPVSGFDRRHLLKNISVLLKLYKSMRRARKILKDFKPQIAIGVGGYVSGPVLKEAQKLGIPTLIQEQNSYAGVTNKLLATKADAICVAYEGMDKFFPADKIKLTGNPVRRNLEQCSLSPAQARLKLGLKPDVKTILIVGGSLGARTINNSIAGGLDSIADADVQIIWQSGKIYDEDAKTKLAQSKAENVLQMPFIADMDIAYRAADLVVSRAGASSISELQLLGKPAILVPSPNVAEDHQTKNALALVNRNAAIMVKDADSCEKLIDTMLESINNTTLLESLAINIGKMALRNADEIIVDTAEVIINKYCK
ncbi:MAG: undecaprenyldiphospho-muramoylpentapeptide beta-N-acetylglucosaminyltransferase [Muribaculaceae bacterium]|nr:undecaprenyldiphospho-muramoylpentapeptide beta-N-acetylglucosaminyltransferase [Muribaculaceae bacterium]